MRSLPKLRKLQSAMEYLMTYGWAILIIAVVMVALFALGIFDSANFAPKAQAGACQVVRNVESVTLQGQCQGELPRYAAVFDSPSSYVSIPYSDIGGSITYSMWAKPTSPPNSWSLFSFMGTLIRISTGNIIFYPNVYTGNSLSISYTVPVNAWTSIIITQNATDSNIYVNGILAGNSTITAPVDTASYTQYIGGYFGASNWQGLISNVQIYNTSLSANDVQQLYLEGIGGAPIDPLHIVGWWPLNGNAQDYSGNSNNGNPSSVSYTSSWTSGYTQP